MIDYESIIKSIKLIRERYYTEPEFNHFSLFNSPWDEVNLHSRFLFFLLNPTESHQLGNTFLQLFIEQVGLTNNFDTSSCHVFKELNHIDILIKNNKHQAIIIENKINASDQDKQLYTYITLLKNQNLKVFPLYLTIIERNPSQNSINGLSDNQIKEIKSISYQNDIRDFIKKSIEKVATKPALRESLVQYLKIIDVITGTNSNQKYMEKLTELLLKDNNLLIVNDFNNAIINSYAKQLFNLWLKIEHEFNKHEEVNLTRLEKPTYSLDIIKHYLSLPNTRYGHGLCFKCNTFKIEVIMVDGIEWRLSDVDAKQYQNSIINLDLTDIGRRGDSLFHVIDKRFDMRNPLSIKELECLVNEQSLKNLAELIVNNALRLCKAYLKEIEN